MHTCPGIAKAQEHCRSRGEASIPVALSEAPINPSHYHGDTVMKIIEDFHLDFLDGTVLKYILRAGQKPGEPAIRDYKKALWYLNRKISNLEKETPK